MAPEPEQVLVQQRAAAVAGDVEGRAEQAVELEERGRDASPPAPRRCTMNENTSIDHTKIGMPVERHARARAA